MMRLIGGFELVVAAGSLALGGTWWFFVQMLCFGAFTVVAAGLWRGGTVSSCGCFGEVTSPPSAAHVVVTAAAAAVSARAAWIDVPGLLDEPLRSLPVLVAGLTALLFVYLCLVDLPRLQGAVRAQRNRNPSRRHPDMTGASPRSPTSPPASPTPPAGVLGRRLGRRSLLRRAAVAGSRSASPRSSSPSSPAARTPPSAAAPTRTATAGRVLRRLHRVLLHARPARTVPARHASSAGWWKADGSGLLRERRRAPLLHGLQRACGGCGCGRAACAGRLLPDCGCGCANGNCNNRKAGCTRFRYGQCNQQVPCVGPIICRVGHLRRRRGRSTAPARPRSPPTTSPGSTTPRACTPRSTSPASRARCRPWSARRWWYRGIDRFEQPDRGATLVRLRRARRHPGRSATGTATASMSPGVVRGNQWYPAATPTRPAGRGTSSSSGIPATSRSSATGTATASTPRRRARQRLVPAN